MEEVRVLLRCFPGCGAPMEILSVSPRPFSSASVVSTTSGRIFIKRHHRNVRDVEGLLEEHRFMRHLCAQGAPVPQVFASAEGATAVETGEWTYEVHEAPAGKDLYENVFSWMPFFSTAHAYSAGQVLARMHLAAKDFSAPRRKPRPLVAGFTVFAAENPARGMESYLDEHPALAEYPRIRRDCAQALELLAPFHAQLLPLLPELDSLWTHNDLHASNLLWSGDNDAAQASAIIDFGLADRTNAVHDLGHAIERSIVEWLKLSEGAEDTQEIPVHVDQLLALLDGYESVRPLSPAEVAALGPMSALAFAEFALTEADYFCSVLHSEANTRICTEGYLVGHARWYRGRGGKILLDAIARWAERRERIGQR
jgi:Ser/Thr protein kinase RdoA (MazF antagonist)